MKVFSCTTGEALERDACDAREMVATGEYTRIDPSDPAAQAVAAQAEAAKAAAAADRAAEKDAEKAAVDAAKAAAGGKKK